MNSASYWAKSYSAGAYVSADNRYSATLHAAGYSAEAGCKLTRHYEIRLAGSNDVIARYSTLAEATRRLA